MTGAPARWQHDCVKDQRRATHIDQSERDAGMELERLKDLFGLVHTIHCSMIVMMGMDLRVLNQ